MRTGLLRRLLLLLLLLLNPLMLLEHSRVQTSSACMPWILDMSNLLEFDSSFMLYAATAWRAVLMSVTLRVVLLVLPGLPAVNLLLLLLMVRLLQLLLLLMLLIPPLQLRLLLQVHGGMFLLLLALLLQLRVIQGRLVLDKLTLGLIAAKLAPMLSGGP